ncbi:MAG: diacylglycerol/lipid kinase family protein [Candidatus Kariarchaeaceae archaeon]
MSYFFIVNPTARNGRGEKIFKKLEKMLPEAGLPNYTLTFSDYAGHSIELTQQAIDEDYNCVVAVGGDGTVNEVANGIGDSDINFAFLPIGNGNDYGRVTQMPRDLEEGLKVIKQGNVKQVPVGEIEQLETGQKNRFINVADCAFSAVVGKAAHTEAKWIKGSFKYKWLAIKKAMGWKNLNSTVKIDGKEFEYNIVLCAFGFGESFGGGLKVLPETTPWNRDEMNILIGHDLSKLEIIKLLNKLPKGKHLGHPKIAYLSGKVLEIETERPVPVEGEGEVYGDTPIRVSVLPHKINLIAPEIDEEIKETSAD